jgi:hypothetical protein
MGVLLPPNLSACFYGSKSIDPCTDRTDFFRKYPPDLNLIVVWKTKIKNIGIVKLI